MENAVVVMIALKPEQDEKAFTTYFRESVDAIRAKDHASNHVTFSLYRPVETTQQFIWITRFPEKELERVTRAAWPLLVLAMRDMLSEIHQRFAANVSVVSSSVLTAKGLVDHWNEEHGRFSKISLESKGAVLLGDIG